jgi:hypothetical protein
MPYVDTEQAARAWVEAWTSGWPRRDPEPIAAQYADGATYRALAYREPDNAFEYLQRVFAEETDIECRFGEPIVSVKRAAVEWWASWIEDGRLLTMAGVTMLRFDDDGAVVDHRDYWNEAPGRVEPYAGW